MIPILENWKQWHCANCPAVDRTNEAKPHTRMHSCQGMGGMTLPMTEVGAGSRVRLAVREDYVGDAHGLVYQNGAPIMAAITDHADGSNDVAVYAPSVRVEMRT